MNPKQIKFVEHYKISGNATEAAKLAGYSAKTATEQGSRLLNNPEIIKAIEDFQATLKKDSQIKVEELIADVLKIEKADIRKLFTAKGKLKNIADWDDATAYAVSEYSEIKGRSGISKKVKLYSKQTAQDMLFKIAGEYVSKISLLQGLDDNALDELVEKLMKENENSQR